MPLVNYRPEFMTHPRSAERRVASFQAGELHFPVAGPQVIPREIWDKTLKSEEFGDRIQSYIDRGVFVVVEDNDRPTLKDYNPTKAASLVNDCFDLGLLQQWREDEARPTVVSAIEAKIKALTPPPAKKEA